MNRETNTVVVPRLERIKSVAARTGLSRSSIWAFIKKEEFPSPVRIGAKAVAWPASEVDAWIKGKIDARG